MYKSTILCCLILLFTSVQLKAQNSLLPLGQEEYQMLDRLETRSGRFCDSLFLTTKPVTRKAEVSFLQEQRQNARYTGLSNIDLYNIHHAVSCSGECVADGNGAINSRHSWFNTFYTKEPDFINVNKPGFFLALNPVVGMQGNYDQDMKPGTSGISYAFGLALRSRIADRVGVFFNMSYNHEEPVSFVVAHADQAHALQGVRDEMNPAPGQYNYLQPDAGVDIALIKNHVNATVGYGKHFIGDGIRTLFLSDYSAPAPYLQLTTRIWKLNYQNLYMELVPQFTPADGMQRNHKYATMHHLSVNVTRWLNLGLFEAVVFDRVNHFEIGYMNPIILYRQTERALGSPDKVNLGFNFKAIAAHHLQFYGQFLLNEFTASQFFSNNGYWANKWGLQLGGKYFDAFTVKNLDLQAELNMVRPYTYTHYDSTANFTHYNQPLAHPLGGGFREFVATARYQPINNLFITVKTMYYEQGVDTGAANYGSDIFKDYDTRSQDFGVHMINGVKTSCALLNLNLTYRIKDNVFADAGVTNRNFMYQNNLYPSATSTYFYLGLRANLAHWDYTQY